MSGDRSELQACWVEGEGGGGWGRVINQETGDGGGVEGEREGERRVGEAERTVRAHDRTPLPLQIPWASALQNIPPVSLRPRIHVHVSLHSFTSYGQRAVERPAVL